MSKYVMGHASRARSAMIRYTLLIGLLLITVASMQVSLLSRFRIFSSSADLMLCTVVCLAFLGGRHTGAIAGIAGGFLIEAMGSSGLMLLPLFYLFLGYVVGHYSRAMEKRYTAYLMYLGIALVYRAAITVFYTCITYQNVNLPDILLRILLPEMLLSAIAGCAIYFPILLLLRRLNKGR